MPGCRKGITARWSPNSSRGETIKPDLMHTYIIAEIGQNHNGNMDIARQLIDVAAKPVPDHFRGVELAGVDAVKFTKRDLDEELTNEAASQPYHSPNAFGDTYIEHRRALELSNQQHKELSDYAHSKGLDLVETICAPSCLELLNEVEVDAVKIASRDVTNIPLLQALSKVDKRILISTGMSTLAELDTALETLSRPPSEVTILHCLSQYPADYDNISLLSIPFLAERYPEHTIGYSDHTIGILMPSVAVALGAKVVEKHITLDRTMKGSDHAGSLEPEGLWRVIRDIRNVERALGQRTKAPHPTTTAAKERLARSLAIRNPLDAGEPLLEENLCMLSPGSGLSWEDRLPLLGKKASGDLGGLTHIKESDFQ